MEAGKSKVCRVGQHTETQESLYSSWSPKVVCYGILSRSEFYFLFYSGLWLFYWLDKTHPYSLENNGFTQKFTDLNANIT